MKYEKLLLLLLSLALFSCGSNETKVEEATDEVVKFPERAKNMNIYEVNIRQYTPEGTINGFAEHLPRLQKMGVDILWIMPIQPIGEKSRKGPLGSYYSIKDYTAVNPNFGTLKDFKQMVNKAHELNMEVILDWVPNHTAFDHPWTEKKGYHTTDSAGNIIWPANTDWTDVADLNYDNQDMRNDMISDMKWWLTETDIDGFRCDVAGEVPNDFWSVAIDSLEKVKDVFMLAEWDEPKMHDAGFHMTYGWGPHHWMNETAKGHIDADSLERSFLGDLKRYGKEPFRMMFTTNHDENSWNGTVFERFGEGHLAYAVWGFNVRSMPLIYSGQEAGLNKRLRFFDKDTISFDSIPYEAFYTKLLKLKHDNSALGNGKWGGELTFLNDGNNKVSSFTRTDANNSVLTIVNLSEENQEVTFEDLPKTGEMEDYMSGQTITLNNGEAMNLAPFQYYVVILK